MRLYRRIAKSCGLTATAAMAVAALAACGSGGGNAANSAASAFDASFNASFDKSTHDSCVTSASQHGAAPDVAEKYCTCVVAELDKLSVPDRMALPAHEEKLKAAAEACKPQ